MAKLHKEHCPYGIGKAHYTSYDVIHAGQMEDFMKYKRKRQSVVLCDCFIKAYETIKCVVCDNPIYAEGEEPEVETKISVVGSDKYEVKMVRNNNLSGNRTMLTKDKKRNIFIKAKHYLCAWESLMGEIMQMEIGIDGRMYRSDREVLVNYTNKGGE